MSIISPITIYLRLQIKILIMKYLQLLLNRLYQNINADIDWEEFVEKKKQRELLCIGILFPKEFIKVHKEKFKNKNYYYANIYKEKQDF